MTDLTPGMPIQKEPASAPLPSLPQFDTGSAPQPTVGEKNAVTDSYHSGTIGNTSGIPGNGLPTASAPSETAVDGEKQGPTPMPPSRTPILS